MSGLGRGPQATMDRQSTDDEDHDDAWRVAATYSSQLLALSNSLAYAQSLRQGRRADIEIEDREGNTYTNDKIRPISSSYHPRLDRSHRKQDINLFPRKAKLTQVVNHTECRISVCLHSPTIGLTAIVPGR
jgi:hypothetical protein